MCEAFKEEEECKRIQIKPSSNFEIILSVNC